HRFAITFHRQRRSKRMTASTLDNIPGLGEVRRKALLRQFGSLRKLGQASAEEIAEVPGIGRRTAESIVAALNPDAATPHPPNPAPAAATPAAEPPAGPTTRAAPAPEPAAEDAPEIAGSGTDAGEPAPPT